MKFPFVSGNNFKFSEVNVDLSKKQSRLLHLLHLILLNRQLERLRMKLIDSVVRSFKVAKVFRENTEKINGIDYSTSKYFYFYSIL